MFLFVVIENAEKDSLAAFFLLNVYILTTHSWTFSAPKGSFVFSVLGRKVEAELQHNAPAASTAFHPPIFWQQSPRRCCLKQVGRDGFVWFFGV